MGAGVVDFGADVCLGAGDIALGTDAEGVREDDGVLLLVAEGVAEGDSGPVLEWCGDLGGYLGVR